jgi:hypothetical protein
MAQLKAAQAAAIAAATQKKSEAVQRAELEAARRGELVKNTTRR